MSYLSLYRKYRPQTFSDVAGQAHIVDVLTNQLANGKLGHAYIFSGTRGTGKTSCAKILARAVNCENPINGNPCNKCRNCLGISDGSILDVTEMDAASNNGVDDVRLLTQEAAYLPSSAKKRVYIIDEVHMLSKGAFNALLKTLEEPPEHVLFILATTELHKVPATIQSRCQTFLFRRISKEIIAERLLEVSAAEQIKLEPSAAAVLARLADGAMRDALSLLERVAGSEIITRETIEQQLGLASGNAIRELYNAAVSGASAAALSLLDRLYREGSDVGAILSQLAAYVRDSLVLSACGAEASPLLSGEYEAAELDLGDSVKLRNIAALLQMTAGELDRSPDRKSAAELLLLQLGGTKLPQNPQPEYKPAQPQAPQATYVPNSGTSVNVNSGAIRAALAPVSQQSTQQAESTVQTAAPQPSTLDWSKIAAAIAHKVNPLLAKELKNGRDITAEASGDTLNLIVSHPFMEMQITDPDVLSSIAAAAAGQSANPVTILINGKPLGTVTEPTASVQDLKQFGDLVKFD
ncbi:MAG: DNA polymerase III subunit gamma/tau [Oscillospiraceae bacterium]|nr:DNA polymerase III subunit gamma/tau [Oscillospiraceae bacterium]